MHNTAERRDMHLHLHMYDCRRLASLSSFFPIRFFFIYICLYQHRKEKSESFTTDPGRLLERNADFVSLFRGGGGGRFRKSIQ